MPTPIPAVALAFVLGASTCVRGQEPVPKPTGSRAQAGDEPATTLEVRVERSRDRQVIDGFGGSLAYWGYNADEAALRIAFEDLGATIVRIPAEVAQRGRPRCLPRRPPARRQGRARGQGLPHLLAAAIEGQAQARGLARLRCRGHVPPQARDGRRLGRRDGRPRRRDPPRLGRQRRRRGRAERAQLLGPRHPDVRLGARGAGRLHGLRVRPAPGRRGAGPAARSPRPTWPASTTTRPRPGGSRPCWPGRRRRSSPTTCTTRTRTARRTPASTACGPARRPWADSCGRTCPRSASG